MSKCSSNGVMQGIVLTPACRGKPDEPPKKSLVSWASFCLNRACYYVTIFVQMHITMTSQWAQWPLKSPASRLIVQPFVRVQMKKTSKLHVTGLCEGNPSVTGGFPSQRDSNAENILMTSSWILTVWWAVLIFRQITGAYNKFTTY